ncbi:VG15 protein [Streptomyces gossypii]|uniref:VG15 protein n=1 Tax=Streptomyces gossypii TaxID=2883101 RepID=UPI004057369E
MRNAGTRAAQAADREAQRGGRDILDRASQVDTLVRGWARQTDGNPCHFCAMLASRGAIYSSRARAELGGRKKPKGSADARNPRNKRPPVTLADLSKYHNGCHCQMIPVYDRNDFMSPQARDYARQWAEVTKGLSGDNARRAWRKHIESQRLSA